jgi:uncharacterized RDD family membrane protein YckC
MNKKIAPVTAGSFRKLFAFIIDSLILGVFAFLLSIPFYNIFFSLGYTGWWVGMIISLLYFSFLQAFFKGQTIGAKILRISLVNNKGNFITLGQALKRNFILLLAINYSNILGLIPLSTNIFIQGFISAIMFSFVAVELVYILFHPQHRGIHDLVSGVYSIKVKQFKLLTKLEKQKYFKSKVNNYKSKKISFIVIGLICVALFVLSIINPFNIGIFKGTEQFINAMNADEGIITSGYTISTFHSWSGNQTNTTLLITAEVNKDTFFDDERINNLTTQLEKQAKKYYLNKHKVDDIQVRFTTGYSIGIGTVNLNRTLPATHAASLK